MPTSAVARRSARPRKTTIGCVACDESIPITASFCPACGASQFGEEPTAAMEAVVPTVADTAEPAAAPPQHHRRRWILVGAGVAVVALIAVGAAAGGDTKKPTTVASSQGTSGLAAPTAAAPDTTPASTPVTAPAATQVTPVAPVASPVTAPARIAVSPPPTAVAPVTVPPATGSRYSLSSPAPVGTPVDVGDGWQVTVLGITPDATQQVLANNQFNDPPKAGHQFFIARVRITRTSGDADSPLFEVEPKAVGPSGYSYEQGLTDDCGVIPDGVPSNDLFPGGSVVGNVCWSVTSGDATHLTMYVNPGFTTPDTYFALT
jgi:hypothetical protein